VKKSRQEIIHCGDIFVQGLLSLLITPKETTDTASSASFFDLYLEFDDSGQLSTKSYDKRDDFNFKIINFPNMCSNIPASPAYGVYISQLIRYTRVSSNYHTLIEKYFWHFCWLPYLYTFSLYENASFVIVSAETEYISTRSWYRNINLLRDRIRRIFIRLTCDFKSVFAIYFTELGTALTTILPILFQYCYKYCYSDSRNLWAVMKAGGRQDLGIGI
jgi:hypothetical protein